MRSKVGHTVIDIPMKVKIQQEGDKWVAVLPGYVLPTNTVVEGDSLEHAFTLLRLKMSKHWSTS
jgi:hypothetical protein